MITKWKSKRKVILVCFCFACILGLVISGYISNAISKPYCEKQMTLVLVNRVSTRGFCYLRVGDNNSNTTEVALQSIGASYSLIKTDPHLSQSYPWIAMDINSIIPFFLRIDHAWEREAEIGGGGTIWYFCFFGTARPLGQTKTFVT